MREICMSGLMRGRGLPSLLYCPIQLDLPGTNLRHPFGRKDGLEYLGVPRTAAQVAPQGLLDVLFVGIGVLVK